MSINYSYWSRAQRLKLSLPAADLSNFPVYLSASSLPTELTNHSYGRSDGGDLAFATDLGTGNTLTSIGNQIPCEVVSASFGGSPSAEIHVQVPSVSHTTNTYIWVLYGNSAQSTQPGVGTTYGKHNVWDSNYIGVWHLSDCGGSIGSTIADSTSNGNNGTNATSNAGSGVGSTTGKVGNAGNFISGQSIALPNFSFSNSAFTVQTWIYNYSWPMSTNQLFGPIVAFSLGGTAYGLREEYYPSWNWNGIGLLFNNTMPVWVPSCTTNIPQASWNHLAATYASSTGTMYVNGSNSLSASHSNYGYAMVNSIGSAATTVNDGANGQFNGVLDEVRLSNIARSNNWLAAEYSNQNAPGTWINTASQNPLSTSDTFFFGPV